ncbi:MAG: hypothetical protein ACFFC6_16940 [Promethearchaeota archaeon]
MIQIDPIIVGDNQFIGVSHLSQESARTKMERFSDAQEIARIMEFASNMGVKAITMSSHSRTRDILSCMKEHDLGNINYYPLIPYVQEYVRIAGEKGTVGLLTDVLRSASTIAKSKILLKGGIGFVKKDVISLLGTLIDIELLPFKGYPVKAIFLHNVLTDLALGIGAEEIFRFYIKYVIEKQNAIPGFATLNFARLVKTFYEWGIYDPLVMASFNKVGFQMNPSREECERCLREYKVDLVAMSTLASGYLKPEEAYEYLFSLPNIKSVAVGVSTREHAEETFRIITKFFSTN